MENKKTIILIVFLVLIILGLGGYIAYDFIKEKEEESNPITVIDKVSIDLNSLYQIGNTLNSFDNAFNNPNSKYFGYIYNSKKILAKNFDQGAALFSAMYNDLAASNTQQVLMGIQVKSKFEKIFGKNLKYASTSIDGGNYQITYNADNDTYSYVAPTNNNFYSTGYITKNIQTSLETDKIIVTRKIIYVEYDTNSSKAILYKDSSKGNKLGELSLRNGELSLNEVIAKYGSRLNTFELTFNESNDNDYNFYQIEKIK